ncbi:TraR/DksA family transcriptional regulator [Nocardioides sp. zg-DK7169]|nr:TraR/DksA C4-type zinc finger protein [Nocardioides sp. zg-DK7169]NPC96561.1 TraR/DksA family transcriptional regulator [Nocardioides sp. zg-DK7169]
MVAERGAVVARLAGLRGDRERFVEASRDSNADDEHDPEGHTIAYERSQVDTHVRLAEQRLAEIDAALERLAAGGYGVCTRCGRPIPPERLAVRPAASTCVSCAV